MECDNSINDLIREITSDTMTSKEYLDYLDEHYFGSEEVLIHIFDRQYRFKVLLFKDGYIYSMIMPALYIETTDNSVDQLRLNMERYVIHELVAQIALSDPRMKSVAKDYFLDYHGPNDLYLSTKIFYDQSFVKNEMMTKDEMFDFLWNTYQPIVAKVGHAISRFDNDYINSIIREAPDGIKCKFYK